MAKAKKKKVTKKRKSSIKKETEKIAKKISSEKKSATNKALIENFVDLQKVMISLSDKFDKLSGNISKLLELFEVSARSLAQKDFESNRDNKESKKILEKLDNISQQAGLIGKGLVLIHELGSEKKSNPLEGYEKGLEFSKEKSMVHEAGSPTKVQRPMGEPSQKPMKMAPKQNPLKEDMQGNIQNSAPKTQEAQG